MTALASMATKLAELMGSLLPHTQRLAFTAQDRDQLGDAGEFQNSPDVSRGSHDLHPPAPGLETLVPAQQGAQARGVDECDLPHDDDQVADSRLLQDGIDLGAETVGRLL